MLQEALASLARKPLIFAIGALLGIAAALAALLLIDLTLWLIFRSPLLRVTTTNVAAPVLGTTAFLGFCVGGLRYTRFHDKHGFGVQLAFQRITSGLKLPVQRAMFALGALTLSAAIVLSLATHRGSLVDFLEYVVLHPTFRPGYTNFFSTVVFWVGAPVSTFLISLAYSYTHTVAPVVRWITGKKT